MHWDGQISFFFTSFTVVTFNLSYFRPLGNSFWVFTRMFQLSLCLPYRDAILAICTVSEWNCERKCLYRVLQCCTIMPSDPPTYAMHPEQKPVCQSFFCLSCTVVVKTIYPRENIECFQWQSSTKRKAVIHWISLQWLWLWFCRLLLLSSLS